MALAIAKNVSRLIQVREKLQGGRKLRRIMLRMIKPARRAAKPNRLENLGEELTKVGMELEERLGQAQESEIGAMLKRREEGQLIRCTSALEAMVKAANNLGQETSH